MNVFRAALSRDFWITGGAIARFFLKHFVRSKLMGISFLTEQKRHVSTVGVSRF
jgi:hypothetical protein